MKGCGAALKTGDLLVIDGRDCSYIGFGVYEVGVYDFMTSPEYMMDRGCRRGVTRCHYQHLSQIVHKVALVGYISPVPNSTVHDLTKTEEDAKLPASRKRKNEADDEVAVVETA